jgi:MFS family permease
MTELPSSPQPQPQPPSKTWLWGMTRYQWTVIFAAWLGWGFDVFDGLLFNYVAPNVVPTLLGIPLNTKEAMAATSWWTGILSAILLLGWAAGGILFGAVADRIGRTRTLLITMLLYAFGTAACALAPNLPTLIVFRIVASLGIGGEWAAGAAMVAEVVPEKRRVEAGALLYTSAPMGLLLADFVTFQITGSLFKGSPETSWRYVFLCGLIPAAVAFVIRMFVKEPERWRQAMAAGVETPRLRELFTPAVRRLTASGFAMALVALVTWWSCSSFIASVSTMLAKQVAAAQGLDAAGIAALLPGFRTRTTLLFNLGGLAGTLLTVPAAKLLGRRNMFSIYFGLSAIAVFTTFGLDLTPETRQTMYLFVGLTVFGVFGSFTYYLPELFPTRLRGTGAGFCYNVGRILTAAGPFVVGYHASKGSALQALTVVAVVPALGVLASRFIVETKGRSLG